MRGAALPALMWRCGKSSADRHAAMDTSRAASDIVTAGYAGLADGSIWLANWQTFEAALAGFASCAIIGVLAGGPRSRTSSRPSSDLRSMRLRPIPAVA